ncbi:MAG: serine protein kinase RIO, partial [Halobacteria archaeon]|nr:serine protein kinase RIO [Halobacteria archaeon]
MELDDWDEIEIRRSAEYDEGDELDQEFDEFRTRLRESERFDTEAEVFDVPTLKALYKLVTDGVLDAIGSPVSTGKEANVFEAVGGREERDGLALKVYRIATSGFDDMSYYLEGDPRFEGLSGKKDTVLAWVRKEFSNLERASEAGVRVPEPFAVERNVLAMEFIGEDGERAPQIREVELENPDTAYEVVVEYVRRLHEAGLVHGDLSEFNILVDDGDIVLIDMGQAVT